MYRLCSFSWFAIEKNWAVYNWQQCSKNDFIIKVFIRVHLNRKSFAEKVKYSIKKTVRTVQQPKTAIIKTKLTNGNIRLILTRTINGLLVEHYLNIIF